MKKLLFIIVISVCVYSCKKSNSNNNTTAVAGTWYVKADSSASNGSPLNVAYYTTQNYYLFNADGTGFRKNDQGTLFTYTVSNNNIYFYYEAYSDNDTTVAAYKDTTAIQTLTANKLTLVKHHQTGPGANGIVTEFQLCSK